MLKQYGIERTDYRNLLIVVGVVALLVILLSEGTLAVRVVVGLVSGLISAVTFIVVTVAINVFKPDYW